MHLVVDAANVIGSRPDGWWRDRAGAAARLVDRLAAALAAGALDPPVTVVLEGAALAGVAAGPVVAAGLGTIARLLVVHAARDGDSAIVALVHSLVADGHAEVAVVTADRGLQERVRATRSTVHGPSWLLARL